MIDIYKMAEIVSSSVQYLIGTQNANEIIKKGAGGQYTRKIDKVAEDTAINFLKNEGVPVEILSEEAGRIRLGDRPEYICLLDPIDGSFNAICGIPLASVSIALAPYKNNATLSDIEYGLVKNIITGDTFEATKGKGAKLNGKKINTSSIEYLEDSTIGLYVEHGIKGIDKLLEKPKRIRNLGCVSLELCYLAKGSYHAFIDLRKKLRVTDIAAGKLIVEEAGGITGNESGSPLNTTILKMEWISIIAAANNRIYEQTMGLLKK
jgi:myo-inositol-1(or 4)-monophosphatase